MSFKEHKFQWLCFIGTGLCRMDILVIVIVRIPKSFWIMFCHRSNFILEIFFLGPSCIFSMFLSVCILLFFLTPLQWFFFWYIYIFLRIYLMTQSFIHILPTKSRMKKIKIYETKFITTKLFHKIKFNHCPK